MSALWKCCSTELEGGKSVCKFKRYIFILMLIILGFGLSGCDLGINDLEAIDGEFGNQLDFGITDLLSPTKSYEYLLDELEYMRENSYQDIQLARKQSFKILNIYGIADISIESSELTTEQIDIQADLFEEIRLINIYVNLEDSYYSPLIVYNRSDEAINLCNELLETLLEE